MNKIIYTVNPIITKETFVFSYKFEKKYSDWLFGMYSNAASTVFQTYYGGKWEVL